MKDNVHHQCLTATSPPQLLANRRAAGSFNEQRFTLRTRPNKLHEDFHHRELQHYTQRLLQSTGGAGSVGHVQNAEVTHLHFHNPVHA